MSDPIDTAVISRLVARIDENPTKALSSMTATEARMMADALRVPAERTHALVDELRRAREELAGVYAGNDGKVTAARLQLAEWESLSELPELEGDTKRARNVNAVRAAIISVVGRLRLIAAERDANLDTLADLRQSRVATVEQCLELTAENKRLVDERNEALAERDAANATIAREPRFSRAEQDLLAALKAWRLSHR